MLLYEDFTLFVDMDAKVIKFETFVVVQYDSDGTVGKRNESDYIRKLLNKPETNAILKRGLYKCPFDKTKPRDGKRHSLVQHVEELAKTAHSRRVRAQQKAVLKVLFPNDEA